MLWVSGSDFPCALFEKFVVECIMMFKKIAEPLPIRVNLPPRAFKFQALSRNFFMLRPRFAQEAPELFGIVCSGYLDRHSDHSDITRLPRSWSDVGRGHILAYAERR